MNRKENKTKYLIDPPEGWRYGFPKVVSEIEKDIKQQCINLGYPKNLADHYREHFHVGIAIIKE